MTETVYLCDPTDIADQMKTGDPELLDRLTRCYGERLLAVGRLYCGDEDSAHDAVQEAYLAAGEHMHKFRGDGSPEGWLVRIVTNACRRMRRGRKNDPTLHDEIAAQPLPHDGDTPEEAAERLKLAKAIGKALIDLPPRDRAIFLLAEAEGWTGPEIAEQFEMTPAAVRVRLTRIRSRLRPQLAEYV